MLSLYQPGNSLIHRLPAWSKLLVLAIVLAVVSMLPKSVYVASIFTGLVVFSFLLSGYSPMVYLKTLWKLKFFALIIFIPQAIVLGLELGANSSAVLLNGIVLATLVTMTTKTSEIVALIQRLTRSENFALLIGLSINSIAVVSGIARDIVEAGKARGVRPSTVRQLINLFVVSLGQAEIYAEALAARGVRV